MELYNPTLLCVVHCGKQADGTSGAHRPLRGGHSYLPLNDILPSQAEDMIDNIRVESDDDAETWGPNPRCIRTKKTRIQKIERVIQWRIVRHQRYLQVIKTVPMVSLPILSKVFLPMRMWPGYTTTIATWIFLMCILWPLGCVEAAAQLQMNVCEDGMHWLDVCARISIVDGYFSGTLEGGWMGDKLELFWRGFGSLFCVLLILLLHWSYSGMKGCVESSWCWD